MKPPVYTLQAWNTLTVTMKCCVMFVVLSRPDYVALHSC